MPGPVRSSVPTPAELPQQVAAALAEDIGSGDLTAALIPAEKTGRATVITREAAIVCGAPYVEASFRQVDSRVRFEWLVAEGDSVQSNQRLFAVDGPARALLTGERCALNFLQLLSATATAAHSYAVLLEGTNCRLLDTRKTIPGLRSAQKYAVRVGGGHNHRMGLFDGILIKENHITAAGSIAMAVAAARLQGGKVPIEVEVENLAQLQQAIESGADIALLDTRKTIPGLRTAQKYAVRVGGGHNHRMGLFDGILIKENHIAAAGAIALAVAAAKRNAAKVPVEVEVEDLAQLQAAIDAGADIALLDNFSLQALRDGVALNANAKRPLKLEASGGITTDTIRAVAETGVDFISVGSITKHLQAVDLSMRFEWRAA